MENKVLDFKGYLHRIDEGVVGKFFGGIGKAVSSAAGKLADLVKKGIIKKIPSGPKAGLPMITYFSQKDGPILDQVNKFYHGISFNESESFEVESYPDILDEDVVPLKFPATDPEAKVRDVGPDDLIEMLEKLYRSKQRGGRAKAIFIYGAPGIGKTQIVAEAADNLGVQLIPLDLQFMAPEDLLGIPKVIDIAQAEFEGGRMVSPGKGITRMNPPDVMPTSTTNKMGTAGGFIFMDEFNRASPRVLNAMMQFVQMGRIGDYVLPPGWVIVGAGNRPEDVGGAGQVAEFDFALAERFKVVNFEPSPEKWDAWARKNPEVFPPELLDFIKGNVELFHRLDPSKNVLKFPTPRSWTDAALDLKDEMIEAGVNNWLDLPDSTIKNVFTDSVGLIAASKLMDYIKVIKRISEKDLEMMVTDPDKVSPLARISGNDIDLLSICLSVKDLALGKARKMNGGKKPTIENLYNIMKYFSRVEDNLEILTAIKASIDSEFPEFKIGDEVLKTKDSPESRMKIEAGMMIKKGMAGKGLLPEK